MADTSIDNLIIVNLNNDAGAALLKAVLAGTTSLVPEDRFELAGPDRVGSWVADLPPIRGGRSVRFGELMWEAWFPKRWQTIEWEPCDWLIQGTFAVGPSQPRRRVSRRLMPPPRDAGRLSDEYTRYWWLRYLRQRESRLGVRVAHAARLLRLASLPHAPDPATQKTAAALRDAFTAQRDAVTQQIQRVVGAHGEASRPPRPESRSRPSAAFGLRWRPNRKEDRVRVRLDFVLLPRSARPTAGTPMTSAVSEVVLPYQTAPRILSLEVVD